MLDILHNPLTTSMGEGKNLFPTPRKKRKEGGKLLTETFHEPSPHSRIGLAAGVPHVTSRSTDSISLAEDRQQLSRTDRQTLKDGQSPCQTLFSVKKKKLKK